MDFQLFFNTFSIESLFNISEAINTWKTLQTSSRQADGDCNTFSFYFFIMSNFFDNENLTCAFSSMIMFIFGSDSIELKYIKNMLMRWSSSQYWFRFATPSHPMLKMRHYWNLNENIEKTSNKSPHGHHIILISSFCYERRFTDTRDIRAIMDIKRSGIVNFVVCWCSAQQRRCTSSRLVRIFSRYQSDFSS